MPRFFAGPTVLLAALLQISPASGADKDRIQQAVDRGVLHLRNLQAADGTWPAHRVGATALVGLTLLECDVPTTDAAVQQAASSLRKAWVDISDYHTTYAVSLTILFFDRLGDPADTPIIQALAARLLGGQNAAGGWSYGCPPLSREDVRRLKTLLERQVELKTKGAPLKPAARNPGDRPTLPKEIRPIISRMEQQGSVPSGRRGDPTMRGGGDNSNTQFAILGLWAARRHGVPVEKALARTAARFRASQQLDGGWSYMSLGGPSRFGVATPSMTCAGLLGLALGYASAREATLHTVSKLKSAKDASAKAAPDPANDRAIRSGFAYLARVIEQPLDDAGPGGGGAGLGDMYYLLWSVERVAVAYSLRTIGEQDWYAWGSAILLAAQRADGGWQGRFGTDVDTSFALLFLRRANLASDLTAYLKDRGLEVALKTRVVPDAIAAKAAHEPAPKSDGGTTTKPSVGKDATVGRGQAVGDRGDKAAKPRADKHAEARSLPVAPADSAPWRPAPKNVDSEAVRLGAELVKASGPEQDRLLDQLKQAKGTAYTEALATVIGQLSGPIKTKAREALADRFAHMTAGTVRDKMKDEATEIRRAAALACAMKAEKQFIPDLATLLEDRQSAVVRAAHAALKDLTGQDLGPVDATPATRSQAAAAWKEWWKKQAGK